MPVPHTALFIPPPQSHRLSLAVLSCSLLRFVEDTLSFAKYHSYHLGWQLSGTNVVVVGGGETAQW